MTCYILRYTTLIKIFDPFTPMHLFITPRTWTLLLLSVSCQSDYASCQEVSSPFSLEQIRPSVFVTTTKPTVILEGPDEGATLRSGEIVTVCRVKDDRLRVSGTVSGWIALKNVVNMPAAAEIWMRRAAREDATSITLIDAALMQLIVKNFDLASKLINKVEQPKKPDPYLQTISILVIASCSSFNATTSQIVTLCEYEQYIPDYPASLLLGKLGADEEWALFLRSCPE